MINERANKMKKVVLILGLIVIAVSLYNHNNNPFPKFTDEQTNFICNEEIIL